MTTTTTRTTTIRWSFSVWIQSPREGVNSVSLCPVIDRRRHATFDRWRSSSLSYVGSYPGCSEVSVMLCVWGGVGLCGYVCTLVYTRCASSDEIIRVFILYLYILYLLCLCLCLSHTHNFEIPTTATKSHLTTPKSKFVCTLVQVRMYSKASHPMRHGSSNSTRKTNDNTEQQTSPIQACSLLL